MELQKLGYNQELEHYIKENDWSEFTIARVTQEHKERYMVSTGDQEYDAEIMGNLRYSANSRADFPAVGDWVAMTVFDEKTAFINHVLPRINALERQAVGKKGEKQIISANIDEALIIQAINNNFSINRFERYLTICHSANIKPVFVLSKTDLLSNDEIQEKVELLKARHKNVKCLLFSNETMQGFDALKAYLQNQKTYCLIGSSGVGKSSLINNLFSSNVAKTGAISESLQKGKHVTSHRELFVIDNGAIIIDTPGMRELGITDEGDGLAESFSDISELSDQCKYSDCTHEEEDGCAVMEAVEEGLLDMDTLINYKKMEREQTRFSSTVAEKRNKDKQFGKMVKSVMKNKKNNNF